MKNILLTIISAVIYLSAQGQDYIPLLQPGNFWQVGYWEGNSICTFVNAHRLNLAGDSLIDGQSYSKFTRQTVNAVNGGPFCWPFETSPDSYQTDILLREDVASKRVFQRIGEEEHLLYDFSLEVGDMFDALSHGEFLFEVEIIDTYMDEYGGIERRFMIANFSGGLQFTLVEGIGSFHGLITPFEEAIGSGTSLMCFGNSITQIEDATCAPIATSTYDTEKVQFRLFPNPAHNLITIKLDNPSKTEVTILNVAGEKIQNWVIQSESQELDISDYPPGIYFVSLETEHTTTIKKLVVQ